MDGRRECASNHKIFILQNSENEDSTYRLTGSVYYSMPSRVGSSRSCEEVSDESQHSKEVTASLRQ